VPKTLGKIKNNNIILYLCIIYMHAYHQCSLCESENPCVNTLREKTRIIIFMWTFLYFVRVFQAQGNWINILFLQHISQCMLDLLQSLCFINLPSLSVLEPSLFSSLLKVLKCLERARRSINLPFSHDFIKLSIPRFFFPCFFSFTPFVVGQQGK